jgi:hypothetical protein
VLTQVKEAYAELALLRRSQAALAGPLLSCPLAFRILRVALGARSPNRRRFNVWRPCWFGWEPVVGQLRHGLYLTDVAAIAITAIQPMMISAIIAPSVILAFSLNVVRLSIFASKRQLGLTFRCASHPAEIPYAAFDGDRPVCAPRISTPQCFMSSLIATPMTRNGVRQSLAASVTTGESGQLTNLEQDARSRTGR